MNLDISGNDVESPSNRRLRAREMAGVHVLDRNAEGEMQFQYFRPGTYTVELTAWDGEKYATMSNQLTINC